MMDYKKAKPPLLVVLPCIRTGLLKLLNKETTVQDMLLAMSQSIKEVKECDASKAP